MSVARQLLRTAVVPALRALPSSSSKSTASYFARTSTVPQTSLHSTARRYASAVSQSQIIPDVSNAAKDKASQDSQAARAEVSLKRFWKTVGIMEQPDGNYFVTLDGRPLRTPSGNRLAIPKERKLAAMLIANEWENQKDSLKVNSLPMTSLAARALDGMSDETIKAGVLEQLMKYLDTDTTCFPEEKPSTLVRLQAEHWAPLHEKLEKDLGIKITSYDSLVLGGGNRFQQTPETREALRSIVEKWDIWQIAALERAVYSTKSFLIAFALVSGRLTADEAAKAAQVEVSSNIELWGEVEDTHDVDYQEIRRSLGSAICLLAVAKA